MERQDVFIRFSDRTNTGIDECCNIVIVRHFALRPEQTIGKFISHLHHGDIDTVHPDNDPHGFQREIIDRLLQLLDTVSAHAFGLNLFARICPEITVMKI